MNVSGGNRTNLNIDVGHGQLQVREDTRNKLRQHLFVAAERSFVAEVRTTRLSELGFDY